MDRAPHQGSLDHRTPFEGGRQCAPTERVQPGPQPDVSGGGVLGLEPTDALDPTGDREVRPFEQELPREQRAVAFALGKGAFGHAAECRVAFGLSSAGTLEDATLARLLPWRIRTYRRRSNRRSWWSPTRAPSPSSATRLAVSRRNEAREASARRFRA